MGLDLTNLLPSRNRDKTIDTLIRNLFNRHLSKSKTVPLFGYVGDQLDLQPGEVQIEETELERQINQLTPFIYAEHATEKQIFSWYDLVQKLVVLGVDYSKISDWFKSTSYNFVPPIDIDKFCNFQEYYWIGTWLENHPQDSYASLGLSSVAEHVAAFTKWGNSSLDQEYYVIQRGASNQPGLTGWSDWALSNLWIHRDDAVAFVQNGINGFEELVQATRPIIEYSSSVGLNLYQTVLGVPSDTGVFVGQEKNAKNQLPMFDLYDHEGAHVGLTSAIFYYVEGQEYDVDSVIGRRLATDDNADFIFGHSLSAGDALYFYKSYTSATTSEFQTIWRKGPVVGPTYSKYDISGTLLNRDKFVNYKNYYWVGVDAENNPAYNHIGLPEYTVIEKGGTSDWSVYNHWVHVSNLQRNVLDQYVHATKPIIEFNKFLESELIESKTKLNQQPRFKQYIEVESAYVRSSTDHSLIDGYLQDKLVVRLSDLDPIIKVAIEQNSDLMANTFEYAGETFIQSLYTGGYYDNDTITTYGYKARLIDRASGYPSMLIGEVESNAYPQILEIEYLGANKAQVTGTVSGDLGVIDLDQSVTLAGVTFNLLSGSYTVGEVFGIEILSYVYRTANRYVNVNGVYRTFDTPTDVYNETQSIKVIESNPSNQDGIWSVPPQLEWNAINETRATIKQGDIYYHLISIIEAQPNLEGASTGNNNWRNLTPDLGLGGRIKQFDGNFSLMVSLLLQEGVTVSALLDFMLESYQSLTTSVRLYVEDKIPSLLAQGLVSLPTGDSIDSRIVERFKTYFSNRSAVVDSSESVVDDTISSPFYDSTSSLYNLVVTLPYLGLAPLVQPRKEYDELLNLNVLVHHDGHRSELATVTLDLAKKIVLQKFKRSSGQETPGIISGFDHPQSPYQGQYWFKTSNGKLYIYDVISDTGVLLPTASLGSYSFNRETNQVWRKDVSGWTMLGSTNSVTSLPWKEVNLDLILQNLELAIEQELYQNCPPVAQRLNVTALESDSAFLPLMKTELEKFGVKYGTTDVYASTFDPENAFTWNYISSFGVSTWQEVYILVYGTARPDLTPWAKTQFSNEAEFIEHAIDEGVLPSGTTSFDVSMWPDVAQLVRSLRLHRGVTPKLSIDVTTGTLIPPYKMGSMESLLTAPPDSAASAFAYNTNGPIETYWKKTADYLYSKQKTYFKIDPLAFINAAWGYHELTTGDYKFSSIYGRKLSPVDFLLHGETLPELAQPSWITATSTINPTTDVTYTFKCVSHKDGIFKITCSDSAISAEVGLSRFMKLNLRNEVRENALYYVDRYISVEITPSIRGFFYGDTFTVSLTAEGVITTGLVPQTLYQFEGMNQVYVQYGRIYGEDVQISLNRSLFNNWIVKLGYRFGGMVNTDSLKLTSQDQVVDDSAYNVYVKENKFYNSSWINALRVQLVHRGSSELVSGFNVPVQGAVGDPGDDWVFRVDNFNPRRPTLTWYEYNLNGPYQTFTALDGVRTVHSWKRYTEVTGVRSHTAPFLVNGIQNLVNFIFGYADKLEADGWKFNDQDNPVLDPSTGRMLGYQLLVEKFIVQQFSNADAGSAFLFNPFYHKVWYQTEHGMVAGVYNVLGLEQESVCSVLDENAKQISKNDVRVFRQDATTQLVFDKPVYTLHLLTSEYEHVLLFENYSVDTLLLYDPFLGQRSSRVFFIGEKQEEFTGRIDFGGHFLIGDRMKKNVESSISEINSLYDTNARSSKMVDRARALLGFNKKPYFKNRGTTDNTEFRFWQGMIANKGTNFSIDAFINSKSYQDARIDEYWAYKIAQYGDAREIKKTEMYLQSEDCATSEFTNYFFLEPDDSTKNTGYDIRLYDIEDFDAGAQLVSRNENLNGMIFIKPNDESRWKTYSDLNSREYFPATVITEQIIPQDVQVEDLIVVKDAKGKAVRADCFEIWDLDFISGDNSYDMFPYDESAFDSDINKVYYETGEYISGSAPARYSDPSFERVNHSTIRILNVNLIGKNLKIVAYGPAEKQFSPHQIVDKVNNVLVRDDVIWWDPARGVHHPRAAKSIDLDVKKDPARYTDAVCQFKTAKLKPWGAEQVGTVWWNTNELYWAPYSDDKIVRDLHDRVAMWGKLSDISNLEIYEWVVSDTKPQAAPKGTGLLGEPAIYNHVKRNRTWWNRPVAWKYSANPEVTDRAFLAYQPAKLYIDQHTAILSEGSFDDLGLTVGSKISGANYRSTNKIDANLTSIFGLAKITSTSKVVVGTTAAYMAEFEFSITPDLNTLKFRDSYLGAYTLTRAVDQLTLTHAFSGTTQTLTMSSSDPATYQFDQLGITISTSATTDLNGAFWSFMLRSSVSIDMLIGFGTGLLDSGTDSTTSGWIAWDDPATNPCTGLKPPFNQYAPMVGEWSIISNTLNLVADEIKLKFNQDWTWFDDSSCAQYRSTWTDWADMLPTFVEARYRVKSTDTDADFNNKFLFTGYTAKELKARAQVYLNETLLSSSAWTIDVTSQGPRILVSSKKRGDLVRVKVAPYTPTSTELAFDPEVKDEDPYLTVQYKVDYPYVTEVLRDVNGQKTITNYYYWVKNKTTPSATGKLSVQKISELLIDNDRIYAIPQYLKYCNQLDGRPNRYGVLSIKNLSQEVRAIDRFLIRLNENPTLRDRDLNIQLKPVHEEWLLLRPNQLKRIPKLLWDKLTDTLVGADALNSEIPFSAYALYDERNLTAVEYGFEEGMILEKPATAIDTVKYTILNTQVDKYENGTLVPDYISYTGFDSSKLDEYLSSRESIRKFMTDLWRFAKPAQVNEIFFNVLQDSAAKNFEMTDFFKTSFISLTDVRTISISS